AHAHRVETPHRRFHSRLHKGKTRRRPAPKCAGFFRSPRFSPRLAREPMLRIRLYPEGSLVHGPGICNVVVSQRLRAPRKAGKARMYRGSSYRLIKGLTGFATFAV